MGGWRLLARLFGAFRQRDRLSVGNLVENLGADPQASGAGRRLDSWKEIASYLKRSVRSVQRWETEEAMPIHRHHHDKRGSVYAFREELDAWWKERGPTLTERNGAEEAPTASPAVAIEAGTPKLAEVHAAVALPAPTRKLSQATLMAVGFGLAVLLVGLVAWLSRNGSGRTTGVSQPLPFEARNWVLVTDFENRTGETIFDGTLEYALARELSNSHHVNVVSRERVGDALRLMRKPPDTRVDAAVGREVCLRDGEIENLLTGRVEKIGSRYLVAVEVVEPKKGTTLASFSEESNSKDNSLGAVRRVSDRVRRTFGEALPPPSGDQRLDKVTTSSLQALQLYSRANSLMAEFRQDTQPAAEELLRQAVAEDPEFASAYIHLAWAMANQQRPLEDYRPYVEKAFRLAGRTTDREQFFIRASYYDLLGQREKAIASYEALISLYPDHQWAASNIEGLYRTPQDNEKAVRLLEMTANLRPKDYWANYQAAFRPMQAWGQRQPRQPYFRRAQALITPEVIEASPGSVSSMELWPFNERWLNGDLPGALRELDRVASKVDSLSGSTREAFSYRMAFAYLALGKVRSAERMSLDIPRPAAQQDLLAQVSFFKGDIRALRRHLEQRGQESVSFPVSRIIPVLQARAGLFHDAEQGLKERAKRAPWPGHVESVRGEMALARRDFAGAVRELEEAARLTELQGLRPHFHLGTESLANALVSEGNIRRAIEVLERASRQKFSAAVAYSDPAEPYWLRNRLDLARLYRRVGRIAEARAIEDDLLRHLALADEDHPILGDLRRSSRS